jgi:hypothetical protein
LFCLIIHQNFKTGFKTGIPVLEFINTEKPVLKIATGIESPTFWFKKRGGKTIA